MTSNHTNRRNTCFCRLCGRHLLTKSGSRVVFFLLMFGTMLSAFQMILSLMYLESDAEWNSRARRENRALAAVRHPLNVSNGEKHMGQTLEEQGETPPRSTSTKGNEKYLLPVLIGNQGFNNQFQALKIASLVAYKRNYTIVLAPFFEHQATLETQRPRSFEESIDSEVLGRFVPVVTLREFAERCNNSVQAMFSGTNTMVNQSKEKTTSLHNFVEASINVYRNHTGIRIPSLKSNLNNSDVVIRVSEELPFAVSIDDFLDRYPESLKTKQKCNAFVYAYGYLNRLPYWPHIQRFNQYFKRSKQVRAIVQRFTTQVLKNSPFVCVHWRFNAEWNHAWCKYDYTQHVCKGLASLTPSGLARNMSNFMIQRELKVAYIASQMEANDPILTALRDEVPGMLTAKDLRESGETFLQGDNYMTSLVEQELCKESTVFLSSEFSSWSDIVNQDRNSTHIERVTKLFV